MSSEIYTECRKILGFANPQLVNAYSEKMLRQTLDIHLSEAGKNDIAKVGFKVNGKDYTLFHEALAEINEFKEIEFVFSNYIPGAWIFAVPTIRAKILLNGVGWLQLLSKPEHDLENESSSIEALPQEHQNISQIPSGEEPSAEGLKKNLKTMFRMYITKHFRPELLKAGPLDEGNEIEGIPYGLIRFEQMWNNVRMEAVVPIQIKVCAYTQTSRMLYHVDLLRGTLLKDIREEGIPQVNYLKRTGLEFFHLDKIMTFKDIPELSKNVLEIIFESKEIDIVELAHIFHTQEKRMDQYVDVLKRKDLVSVIGKPPNEKYSANMDAMIKATG